MRIAAVMFQLACFAFALFLGYQIASSIDQQNYELMEIVSNVGTILICIDLGIFLHFNKSIAFPQNNLRTDVCNQVAFALS